MNTAWIYIKNEEVVAIADFELTGVEHDRVKYVESEEDFVSAELNKKGRIELLTAEQVESRLENN